jgi:IS1 family transposase
MNRMSLERRAQVLRCLCEGNGILATVRMTGAAKNSIVKLLADVGSACLDYQDEHLNDLPCRRIQCDEIWSFCYAKAKNVPEDKQGQFGYGDVWTWTAIDADTKLIPCWTVGRRTLDDAKDFMLNLAARLRYRPQISTDGLGHYIPAIELAFAGEVDYAMIVKTFGDEGGKSQQERKYSPGEVSAVQKVRIHGNPVKADVSTSYVERQNLTMRMSMRRYTRLTNGHSKKVENHMHMTSLHFMFYNFARPHASLKGKTPAMAAGVSDHVWSMEEIAALSN